MASQASKRIAQELETLRKDPPESFAAGPSDDSILFRWTSEVFGPPCTPYANKAFSLALRFPEDYPARPFHLEFETPVYHPNISENGKVYLEELDDQWSPACTVRTILLSLQALMFHPDPLENVLNADAAALLMTDMDNFKETARGWQGARGSC